MERSVVNTGEYTVGTVQLKVLNLYVRKGMVTMATDWIPAIIIGIALLIFSAYLFITKNITALIGMQVIYLKTSHQKVATISAVFLLVTSILTFLLPLTERINITFLIINLTVLFLVVLSLFWYLYKQKMK